MFDSQLLVKPSGESVAILGPWMPRGGDNAAIAIDVIAISLTDPGVFEVTMETKAAEDAGDGGTVSGASISVSSTGRHEDVVSSGASGMKELVRYKYTFDSSTATDDWILFRMLPPSWYDTVTA